MCRSMKVATAYMPIPITAATSRPANASGTSKRDDATSIKMPKYLFGLRVGGLLRGSELC
jgi:hypothetical protein